VATLVWLPEALDDIARLYDFLADKNPAAAMNAASCVKAAAQQLEQFPQIGRRVDETSERREIFAAFGAGAYVLRYRLDTYGNVVVIRVWHSRELRHEG
jgi:plasmid stabilization system protein ParE